MRCIPAQGNCNVLRRGRKPCVSCVRVVAYAGDVMVLCEMYGYL